MPQVAAEWRPEPVHHDLVGREVEEIRIVHRAMHLVDGGAQDGFGDGVCRDAGDWTEARGETDRGKREDDRGLGPVLANQVIDPAQTLGGLGRCGDPKLVSGLVELAFGNGPPEGPAGQLVVPDLRKPEGENEHVGLVEQCLGGQAHLFIVFEPFALPAMPQLCRWVRCSPTPIRTAGRWRRH